jgi:hypothetical protein
MKTQIQPVILFTVLAFVLPVSGQNRDDRRRVVLPSAQQVQPPPVPQPMMPPGVQPRQPTAAELPHNVKLTLEGSLFGIIPTDFSVTTGGTTVSSDMTLESKEPAPTIGTIQAVITPGDPWLVAISIGARVATPAGNGNIQYQDQSLSTTVRISPGKKVVRWEKGDQKLTLLMEKVED